MTGAVTAAVVGCGDVSAVHLEAIRVMAARGAAQLVAVCDINPDVADEVSRAHGVTGFRDHLSMLAAVDPDVVHVCTPHDQHLPVVLDCLEAGVHVLVEKPLAHNVSEAQLVVDAARRHPHLKVGVCLQNRYNATAQAARQLLQSGELGAVHGGWASVVWRRPAAYYTAKPWRGQKRRSGGGVLINQAIHTLDLLQWLLGDVHEVSGHAERLLPYLDVDVEDTADVLLVHAGGARSMLFATVAGAVDSPVTLEITTENAVLFVRGDLTITWTDGRVETVPERQADSVGRSYWGVSHTTLIDDFYRRLAEPGAFWIGPEEAMASLRIVTQVV
jgi:UDP-N-acetyl-2-amino-2-deoxyglucuronate dehydrogenase